MWNRKKIVSILAGFMLMTGISSQAEACTGITLTADNGAVVYGRTMEWGTFDLLSQLHIVPRGHQFTANTPEGQTGISWTTDYGFVAFDVINKEIFSDGMNEEGLTVGTFYHPGYAGYKEYDPSKADLSMAATDLGGYLLSKAATVDQARELVNGLEIVEVIEEVLGFAAPVHYIVTDKSGDSIVIEFNEGKTMIHDNPLGVVTNAPNYDWHMTNLNNYVNLRGTAAENLEMRNGVELSQLGGGSGMLGLPGDFTPVSRFVRAALFSHNARETVDGLDTSKEVFRILDNFNVPISSSEGDNSDSTMQNDIISATQWTSAWDSKDLKLYFHTQYDRRTKSLDLSEIDFGSVEYTKIPIDNREDDIKEISL